MNMYKKMNIVNQQIITKVANIINLIYVTSQISLNNVMIIMNFLRCNNCSQTILIIVGMIIEYIKQLKFL